MCIFFNFFYYHKKSAICEQRHLKTVRPFSNVPSTLNSYYSMKHKNLMWTLMRIFNYNIPKEILTYRNQFCSRINKSALVNYAAHKCPRYHGHLITNFLWNIVIKYSR